MKHGILTRASPNSFQQPRQRSSAPQADAQISSPGSWVARAIPCGLEVELVYTAVGSFLDGRSGRQDDSRVDAGVRGALRDLGGKVAREAQDELARAACHRAPA